METTDRFSLWRMLMYGRLYAAPIRLQGAIYLSVSLLIGLLTVFCAGGMLMFLLPLVMTVFCLMVGAGPLVFASSRGRAMLTALPASGGEKGVFTVLYTFVVVPVLAFLPFVLCVVAGYGHILGARDDMGALLGMTQAMASSSAVTWPVSLAFMASVCLLAVSGPRGGRQALPLLAVAGSGLLLWLSDIVCVALSLKSMYAAGILNPTVPVHVSDNQQLFDGLAWYFSNYGGTRTPYGAAEAVVLLILAIVLTAAALRRIKNRQL